MAQELVRYHPTKGGHEGWLAQVAELIAISNEDLALGVTQGVGAPDPPARPHAPRAGNA
jgi:hypothetical protein